MRVFLAGATGMVGQRLVQKLLDRGDQVLILTRRPEQAKALWRQPITVITGDPLQPGDWQKFIPDCDAAVNLTGEGIFNRRWSASFKELLRSSRIVSTENVVAALKRPGSKVKVLVNASAIGIFGPHGDEDLVESSPPGSDFLAQLCIDWEKAAFAAESATVRVAVVRVGVVLDRGAGALQKMLLPFKMFVGGPIGSGRQYMSWIHNEDLAGLFLLALDRQDIRGPINGSAPTPKTNKEFSKALGKVLHRPSFMPTPGFALRVALGEVAGVVTQGQKVLPKKALDSGFHFKYPELEGALGDLFSGQ